MKHTLILTAAVCLCLSGCDRFRPQHTTIRDSLQTAMNEPVVPTSVMIPKLPKRENGSLWQPGSKQFFKDSRAANVGDIITVVVNESSFGSVEANTDTDSTVDNTSGITNLLNLEGKLTSRGIAPGVASLIDLDSNRTFEGESSTDRTDRMTGNIAAVVTQVLPNGYLVIQGSREVMINYELKEMGIQGIVRPEDVAADNTISSEKIAEARISLAGRGIVDESMSAPAGVRFLDKWLPF